MTVDFAKAARANKILIDYERNYRGAIAAAAFLPTRALPNGTLSVPVAWRYFWTTQQKLPLR